MAQITDLQWGAFKSIINKFDDNVNKEILEWGTRSFEKDEFGEENPQTISWVNLEALLGFNTFRTWPMTDHRMEGELDNQNMVAYINKDWLNTQGYLTIDGYFNFNPAQDVFKHRGIIYKCDGDTLVSQTKDDSLFIMLVLVRQVLASGENKYEQ
jgi:hypothetical protein